MDLSNVESTGVTNARLVATLALPDAVGCTAASTAAESCRHSASVTVAPGNGTVFVLGPRGIAAVPLPDSLATASNAGEHKVSAQATPTTRPAGTVRVPLRSAVKSP